MLGERNMIRAGYRWDVIAIFIESGCGVKVATRKTKRGAEHHAETFRRRNRRDVESTHLRLRHDVMNERSKSR